jgi:translation initiation factor 1
MGKKSKKIQLHADTSLEQNPFEGLSAQFNSYKLPAAVPQQEARLPQPKRRIEMRRETSGRAGKTVTTLCDAAGQMTRDELKLLLQELKHTCACGGALKGAVIELQGDVRTKVRDALNRRPFHLVAAGG